MSYLKLPCTLKPEDDRQISLAISSLRQWEVKALFLRKFCMLVTHNATRNFMFKNRQLCASLNIRFLWKLKQSFLRFGSFVPSVQVFFSDAAASSTLPVPFLPVFQKCGFMQFLRGNLLCSKRLSAKLLSKDQDLTLFLLLLPTFQLPWQLFP